MTSIAYRTRISSAGTPFRATGASLYREVCQDTVPRISVHQELTKTRIILHYTTAGKQGIDWKRIVQCTVAGARRLHTFPSI